MKNVKYINAGAGSGKTWTLSHRLSDALLEKDEEKRVDPSQVILTTFTRAAASEFREKARAVLIEAGEPEVAAALEGAAIGTVHSVCEQFVKKYWYRLGLSPEMGVLQEDDKRVYVNQSIASILKGRDAEIDFFNGFQREFNISARVDNKQLSSYPDWWKDSLKKILSMMSNYGISDLEESVSRSCAEIGAVFCGPDLDTTEMLDFLKKYESYILSTGAKSDTAQKALKKIGSVRRSPETIPSIVSVLKIVDFSGRNSEFVGGANAGVKKFLQQYPSFDFDIFHRGLKGQLISRTFGEKVKKAVEKVFTLAEEWQDAYRDFKARNHVLDFDDLERYFLKMLQDKGFDDVREEIKNTFKLLMVDEFQDSNPVQIAIFDKLSDLIAEGGGSTLCVGDPKQSIYAFRGSDLALVKTVTDKCEKEEPLKTSFRSRPRLVELANNVFLQAFQGELDKEDIELPGKDRDASELVGKEPIRHWVASNLAEDLANKIYEILYGNPWTVCRKKKKGETKGKEEQIHPKDIAVLCRFGFEVNEIVAALRDAGVPVTSSSMDFVNWAECQLLQSLLRWVNNPADDGAKADIWHLLEGVPTETILLDRQTYLGSSSQGGWLKDHKLFKELEEIRNKVRTLPVSVIISTLILELDLMRVCQKWGHPVARCKNLGMMQKIAAQYEDHCFQMNLASSIPGFISYLHSMPDDLKNEDTTSDTVKVITYHKSKGLEWPVVILGSLSRLVDNDDSIAIKTYTNVTNCKAGDGTWIFFCPPLQGSSKTLPERIQQGIVASRLYQDIKQRYIREETRLLYVGLTRARDYVVTLSEESGELRWIKDCGCGTGDVTEHDGKVNPWNQPGYEAVCCLIAGMVTPASAPKKTVSSVKSPTPIVHHLKKYVSPSKITPSAEVPVSLTQFVVGPEMIHSIQSADSTACGTCVHNFFAAYRPEADDEENVSVAKRIIDGADLSAQLTSPESLVSSAKQFFSWMKEKYRTEEGLKREVPFLFMADGKVVSPDLLADGQTARGEMDLLWVRDKTQKTCVLVDYKSYHGCRDLDSANPEVRKHYQGYAPQLLVYKKALERAGWTVEDVLVYYFIQGRVVQFTFK